MRRRHPRHRVQELEASSSSSFEVDQENEDRKRSISVSSSHSRSSYDTTRPSVPLRHRRRRKRKPSSENTKNMTIRQKISIIERALVHLDDEISESLSDEAIDQVPKRLGRSQLRDSAIGVGGLINDDLRRKVWPRLLNIDLVETSVSLDDKEVKQNKNYTQVLMDVNRSLKRFPPGISDEDRPELQDQLTRLIIRVLDKHPELHYYQGYHDVAITFLLVVGEEMSFHILEKLSTGPWLREFMHPTMEKTTYLLNFIYPIIQAVDSELYDFLEMSEVGTIFALPWLITWFGHVLPDYSDVVRLYDFFLAQPPMMAVYLAAAIVLHRSCDVMQVNCDMASVHGILAGIPLESPPFEYLLNKANELYYHFPPETIENDVRDRMKKIEEALVPKKRKPIENFVIKKAEPPSNSKIIIKSFVFVTAPVLLGVFLFRFVQNQYL